MPGIRLHHPVFTNCTYVVELDLPLVYPTHCVECNTPHQKKSIHLRLDQNGDCIVSLDVLDQLRTRALGGMEVVNEIQNPPAHRVGAVSVPKREVYTAHLNGGQDPSRLWQPGKDKWESEEATLRTLKPWIEAATRVADKAEWDKKHKKGLKFFDLKPKPKKEA